MALSTVSQGLSTVFVTAGLAILPIAADLITSIALKKLAPRQMMPRTLWAVSILPASVVFYLTSGIPQFNASSIIKIGLYVAYKALVFARMTRSESRSEYRPVFDDDSGEESTLKSL